MGEIRIVLDEKDFIKLVNGEEVTQKILQGSQCKIILSDIGFDRMMSIIVEAENK